MIVSKLKKIASITTTILLLAACGEFEPKAERVKTPHQPTISKQQEQPIKEIEKKQLYKITMIVPTSGLNHKLGNAMIDAANLALLDSENKAFTLNIIDENLSEIDLKNAVAAAIKDGSRLIIGPLLSSKSQMIKNIALEHKVTILSFSNNKLIAGENVFALGFAPDEQVKTLINYAQEHNISNFYALLPADQYGKQISTFMRQQIASEKATIVKTEFYTNDEKELSLAVASIAQLLKQNAKMDNGDLNGVQGLFIAEGGEKLRQILALLQYHEVDLSHIKLLGSGQWDDYETIHQPQLEGAWFASSLTLERQKVQNAFTQYFGYQMPILAALAYDAILIANFISREDASFAPNSFKQYPSFLGASGEFNFGTNNIARHKFNVLTINDGNLEIARENLDPDLN